MKKDRTVLLIIAVIVIWFYSKKLQAAKSLTVRYLVPQDIRISQGAIKCVEPIVITNPTATPIDLQRYSLLIYLEGYQIGTAFGTALTTLSAGRDTMVMSNVVIPISSLISIIPDIMNAGKSLDLRFTGSITAELITIPIDTYIKFPIPKILQEWI